MSDLSPVAQAVLDAVIEICPAPADEIAAAALRAAADQVVPDVKAYLSPGTASQIRSFILAIAAELEGSSDV